MMSNFSKGAICLFLALASAVAGHIPAVTGFSLGAAVSSALDSVYVHSDLGRVLREAERASS